MNIALCLLKMRRIWVTVLLKQTDRAKLCVQPVLVFAVRKLVRHQRSAPPWQASQWARWYLSATLWRSARVAKTARIWKADFFLKNTSKRSGLPVSHLCMLPRRRGRTKEESKVGEKYARQIEFAMAGCDAKTGPTKTEFRAISQNKLAHGCISTTLACFCFALLRHDKLVVILFRCIHAEYQLPGLAFSSCPYL